VEIRELEGVETAVRPLVKLAADNQDDPPALTVSEAAPTCAP
jgi:hypothetical protein